MKTEDCIIIKKKQLLSLQPDVGTDAYQHGFHDAIQVVIDISSPSPACAGTKDWGYCPECGTKEFCNENLLGKGQRCCVNCGQDWWLDIDYSEIIREKIIAKQPNKTEAVEFADWQRTNCKYHGNGSWIIQGHYDIYNDDQAYDIFKQQQKEK